MNYKITYLKEYILIVYFYKKKFLYNQLEFQNFYKNDYQLLIKF